MLRSQDTLDTEALCGVRYDWLSRQDVRDTAIMEWEELVGGPVQVFPIAGNHFEPFLEDKVSSEHFIIPFGCVLTSTKITQTASQLWRACQYIEHH
jgi:hypothetical protein